MKMTGSLGSDICNQSKLCIDEGPPLPYLAYQDMPLDLSISKSCHPLLKPRPSALRVRTDLIGSASANEEKALDLTSKSKRRHLEDNDEGDYSPRDLTIQPASNHRLQPFGIRALMDMTSASTSPCSDRSSSPLQYPSLFPSNSVSPPVQISSSYRELKSPNASFPFIITKLRENEEVNTKPKQIGGEIRVNEAHKRLNTVIKSAHLSAPPPLISSKSLSLSKLALADKLKNRPMIPAPPIIRPGDSNKKLKTTVLPSDKQTNRSTIASPPVINPIERDNTGKTALANKLKRIPIIAAAPLVKPVKRESIIKQTNKVETNIMREEGSYSNPGIWNVTLKDMENMFEPYITHTDKKFNCTICETKFVQRDKIIGHIENKHIDCFQYKCPLCRTTKTSRLAFDCHIRSRHTTEKKKIKPYLRLKRQFFIKEDKSKTVKEKKGLGSKKNPGKRESYDLLFVTFLRNELSEAGSVTSIPGFETSPPRSGTSTPVSRLPGSDERTGEQEILSVATSYLNSPSPNNNNNSKGLPPLPQLIPSSITPPTSPSTSSSTSTSPESSASLSSSRDGSLSPPEEVERALGTGLPGTPGPLASWISRDQGMFVIKEKQKFASKWFQVKGQDSGSWQDLQDQVLSIFQKRNILKVISETPTVFQVFCIRQLLQ